MVSERESIILFLIVAHVVIRVSELAEEVVLLLLLGRPTKNIILVLLRVVNIEIIKLIVYGAEVVCLGLLHGIPPPVMLPKSRFAWNLGIAPPVPTYPPPIG